MNLENVANVGFTLSEGYVTFEMNFIPTIFFFVIDLSLFALHVHPVITLK